MARQRTRDGKHNARQGKYKKHETTWRQRLLINLMAWAATVLTWFVRLTCRIQVVHGAEHVDTIVQRGGAMIPCGWHQRIISSGLFLRTLGPRGLRIGFLISPSREGDFIDRVAQAHGVETLRGSSSRSGKEAMRHLTQAVADGISPTMYGDGPRGPAGVFKPGAVILAGRSGMPLFPVGCYATRFWQLKSWDRGQIPKPFTRILVAVGEPWFVQPHEGEEQAEAIAERLGCHLKELDTIAESAA